MLPISMLYVVMLLYHAKILNIPENKVEYINANQKFNSVTLHYDRMCAKRIVSLPSLGAYILARWLKEYYNLPV